MKLILMQQNGLKILYVLESLLLVTLIEGAL